MAKVKRIEKFQIYAPGEAITPYKPFYRKPLPWWVYLYIAGYIAAALI